MAALQQECRTEHRAHDIRLAAGTAGGGGLGLERRHMRLSLFYGLCSALLNIDVAPDAAFSGLSSREPPGHVLRRSAGALHPLDRSGKAC